MIGFIAAFPFTPQTNYMTYLIALTILILSIATGVFFLGREGFLTLIFGPADKGPIVFQSFKRSITPNNALICPENYCDNAVPEIVAPVFEVSADKLRERLRIVLEQESGLERVHTNDPSMNERYVQRSRLFKFPDTIQVEYIPLTTDRSTIALYSRSKIGFSDRKVNLKRLKRWLKKLNLLEIG